MSWKSQKAFKRIFNTFKRLNKQIYQEDIDALKDLNEIVEDMTELRIKDNTLFAKLLCNNIYWNMILTNDIQQSIRMVQDDLDVSLNEHIKRLTHELNHSELVKLMKSKGIEFELKSNKEEQEKIIKENQREFTQKVLDNWDFDTVQKSFYKTANEMISNPDNYSI